MTPTTQQGSQAVIRPGEAQRKRTFSRRSYCVISPPRASRPVVPLRKALYVWLNGSSGVHGGCERAAIRSIAASLTGSQTGGCTATRWVAFAVAGAAEAESAALYSKLFSHFFPVPPAEAPVRSAAVCGFRFTGERSRPANGLCRSLAAIGRNNTEEHQ